MKDLKMCVTLAKNNYNDAMMEIINMFEPKIRKYDAQMEYDEDFRADMIEFLIKMIRTTDFSNMRVFSTGSLVNYINESLKNQFILLSKARRRARENELHYESADIESWLGVDYDANCKLEFVISEETMKRILTEREYICVKLMIIDSMSSAEAANVLGIARQTVNEAKIRGLKKLKAIID